MFDNSAVIQSLTADFGKPLDQLDPSDVKTLVDDLVRQALVDDVVEPTLQDALNNLQADALRDRFIEFIQDSDLPEAVKSEMIALVNQRFDAAAIPNIDPAFENEVEARYGVAAEQAADDLWDLIYDTLDELHAEETQKLVSETPEKGEGGAEASSAAGGAGAEGAEAGGGADGAGGGGGGDVPNWLVALARAMAAVQTQWAERMSQASDAMVATADSDSKSAFIAAQNDFAAYARLFSMASEQASTAIKSVGDGLTSVARKQ